MADEIGLIEAIYTQRSIRHFKPDPVPRDLLHRVLEAATKAPNGGNRQPWHFLVVDDPGLKGQIGELYRKTWYPRFYLTDGTRRSGGTGRADPSKHLADHLEETPVLIFVCLDRNKAVAPAPPGVPPVSTASVYASIFPAVQNLQLAARGFGLGTTITTALTHAPEEVKTLLGIPPEMELCTMVPLGWPADGVRFGPTTRRPAEEVTHYNGW